MPTERTVARAGKASRKGLSVGAQVAESSRSHLKKPAKKSVRGGERGLGNVTATPVSAARATRAKRKISAKKAAGTNARAAGATRAARTRAMRARAR